MKGTNSSFSFQIDTKKNTEKLIANLDNKKAIQSADIPIKLVKGFACFQVLVVGNRATQDTF